MSSAWHPAPLSSSGGAASISSLLNATTDDCTLPAASASYFPATPESNYVGVRIPGGVSAPQERGPFRTPTYTATLPTRNPSTTSGSTEWMGTSREHPDTSHPPPPKTYPQRLELKPAPLRKSSSSPVGHLEVRRRRSTKSTHSGRGQTTAPEPSTAAGESRTAAKDTAKRRRGKRAPTEVSPSSPASSAVTTPMELTSRHASLDSREFGSGDNVYDDDDNDDNDDDEGDSDAFEVIGKREEDVAGSRSATLGRPRSMGLKAEPMMQRERNRVAATKCRAKTKAAITKLEEDERAMSDRRDFLSAERTALMNEVLYLRLELLRHSKCPTDTNIQNYLRNAAVMIGETGGKNNIWGPDGSGRMWPMDRKSNDCNDCHTHK